MPRAGAQRFSRAECAAGTVARCLRSPGGRRTGCLRRAGSRGISRLSECPGQLLRHGRSLAQVETDWGSYRRGTTFRRQRLMAGIAANVMDTMVSLSQSHEIDLQKAYHDSLFEALLPWEKIWQMSIDMAG